MHKVKHPTLHTKQPPLQIQIVQIIMAVKSAICLGIIILEPNKQKKGEFCSVCVFILFVFVWF